MDPQLAIIKNTTKYPIASTCQTATIACKQRRCTEAGRNRVALLTHPARHSASMPQHEHDTDDRRTAPSAVTCACAPRLRQTHKPSRRSRSSRSRLMATNQRIRRTDRAPLPSRSGRVVAAARRVRATPSTAGHQHTPDKTGVDEVDSDRPHQCRWLDQQRGGIRHAGECPASAANSLARG